MHLQYIRKVIIPIGPSIAYVPLTRGQWSLIDAGDAALVGQWNWYALWDPKMGSFYAARNVKLGCKKTLLLMHVLLANPPIAHFVDHRNGMTLDNRRSCNLRGATRSQNSSNSKRPTTNRSGYKGVSWDEERRKWRADIKVNQKSIVLGRFADPKEAHDAYCRAANLHQGEFGRIA